MKLEDVQKFTITLDSKDEFKGMTPTEIAEFVLKTSNVEYHSINSCGFKQKKNGNLSKKIFLISAVITSTRT